MKTTVTERGSICTARDLIKLDIIDWNRLIGYWDNTAEASEAIASWLIEAESEYCIVKCDMNEAPDREDWPGWKHVGNHEELGKLYWNWFHWKKKGKISFSDSPDFNGVLRLPNQPEAEFYGDIGQVSAPTFMRSIKLLHAHDMWISIPDSETQILIEPMISIRQLWIDFFSNNPGSTPQEKPDFAQLKLF